MTTGGLPLLARRLLRFDGAAGLLAGASMLVLHEPIAGLHAFPVSLVLAIGAANVAYGTYSSTLAIRDALGTPPRRWMVNLLAGANLTWTLVCLAVVASMASSANASGLAHVGFEGLFVGGLGLAERRWLRPATR